VYGHFESKTIEQMRKIKDKAKNSAKNRSKEKPRPKSYKKAKQEQTVVQEPATASAEVLPTETIPAESPSLESKSLGSVKILNETYWIFCKSHLDPTSIPCAWPSCCRARCYTDQKWIILTKEVCDEPSLDYYQSILRHEIVHGFFYESGFRQQGEEILVDWIAYQAPKILSVFNSVKTVFDSFNCTIDVFGKTYTIRTCEQHSADEPPLFDVAKRLVICSDKYLEYQPYWKEVYFLSIIVFLFSCETGVMMIRENPKLQLWIGCQLPKMKEVFDKAHEIVFGRKNPLGL